MGKIVGLVFEEEAAKLVCPHCGKEYKTEDALAKHIESKHPDAGGEPPQTEE